MLILNVGKYFLSCDRYHRRTSDSSITWQSYTIHGKTSKINKWNGVIKVLSFIFLLNWFGNMENNKRRILCGFLYPYSIHNYIKIKNAIFALFVSKQIWFITYLQNGATWKIYCETIEIKLIIFHSVSHEQQTKKKKLTMLQLLPLFTNLPRFFVKHFLVERLA